LAAVEAKALGARWWPAVCRAGVQAVRCCSIQVYDKFRAYCRQYVHSYMRAQSVFCGRPLPEPLCMRCQMRLQAQSDEVL
jgi:hypothetical protein